MQPPARATLVQIENIKVMQDRNIENNITEGRDAEIKFDCKQMCVENYILIINLLLLVNALRKVFIFSVRILLFSTPKWILFGNILANQCCGEYVIVSWISKN